MKELDVLLLRYADAAWPVATPAERGTFEQLLELPDPVLAAYLLGHETPPPEFAPLVARLRAG